VEASTLDGYRAHADLHIKPVIGSMLLANLTPATVKYLGKKLHESSRSPALIAKVRASLCGILTDAVTDGLVARNVVREQRRGGGGERDKRQVELGRDIPHAHEVKAILEAAKPRWRTLLLVAATTGMRASEIRGLR
jgi:integrase